MEDANGNTNTRALLAYTGYDGSDAVVTDEWHADNGHVVNQYNAFGDLTESTNEVGAVTDYTYDKDGNLLTERHPFAANGTSRLTDTYTYDGLGERLTHYNSELTSSVVETTDYDAEGRVLATVDYDDHITTYRLYLVVGRRDHGARHLWRLEQGHHQHRQPAVHRRDRRRRPHDLAQGFPGSTR